MSVIAFVKITLELGEQGKMTREKLVILSLQVFQKQLLMIFLLSYLKFKSGRMQMMK